MRPGAVNNPTERLGKDRRMASRGRRVGQKERNTGSLALSQAEGP